ncbi:hypothetical protein [Streptomyces meridianus]|uniref:Transmembrane protein n=1 Tax=Streptomyces meridianus TaxID=2938945 RepID=A0ABT0X7P2_9ACTN|nr:hypothetical protein [Streptomyces meridianus]MCM2578536.1 hypothetical protein [Streptomyces meridianus]
MNSSQDLLPEDRPEFERVLHEALRRSRERPGSAVPEPGLTTEQLRTLALDASAGIAASAADEYRHYLQVRRAAGEGGAEADPAGADPADEGEGPGMLAMVSVLAPVLAAVAAVLFLLTGYLLRAVGSDAHAAASLIGVGWVFAALTGGALVLAMGGLLVTALRDGAAPVRTAAPVPGPEEVARAREAWRQALLERGVLPFLRDVPAAEGPAVRRADGAYGDDPRLVRRMPDLGYSRPDFSSPAETGDGAADRQDPREGSRPSFNSPGYSSPDYGSPDHEPG